MWRQGWAARRLQGRRLGRLVCLLDASFFMGREDVDCCLRARPGEYRFLCAPDARVWHRLHFARSDELPRVAYYMTRISLLLVTKDMVTACDWAPCSHAICSLPSLGVFGRVRGTREQGGMCWCQA